jgi:hypothetical protein
MKQNPDPTPPLHRERLLNLAEEKPGRIGRLELPAGRPVLEKSQKEKGGEQKESSPAASAR